MSDTSSRFLRALRDIALAMVNATLILIALCLFLGLRLTNRMDAVATHAATEFAQGVASVDPLRAEVKALTGEVAGLRTDLAEVRAEASDYTSETAEAVTARLAAFEARLDQVGTRLDEAQARIQSARIDPEALVSQAVETGIATMTTSLGELAGCDMPVARATLERLAPPTDGDGRQ